MAIIQIIHFDAVPLLDAPTPRTTVDDTLQNAIRALHGVETPQHFVLGTQIQDKGAVQITAAWDGVQDYSNFKTSPELTSFIKSFRNLYGEPQPIFHVPLNQPAFGPSGPATANVVEYVQVYFPTSLITLSFQRQIEEDFVRFDEIFKKGSKGDVGLAFGWVLEEQEHEKIEGEKAKCFFITRGWESMDCFEESVKHDAYKEAIPLLLAWNAPFKMVGVCFAV